MLQSHLKSVCYVNEVRLCHLGNDFVVCKLPEEKHENEVQSNLPRKFYRGPGFCEPGTQIKHSFHPDRMKINNQLFQLKPSES